MPNVPVIDLDYHSGERMLAAATYGRGMYSYSLGLDSSTEEISDPDLSIYPVPADKNITIVSSEFVIRTEIYDLGGNLIRTYSRNNLLDISGLKSGTYVLKIHTENSVTVKKCLIFN